MADARSKQLIVVQEDPTKFIENKNTYYLQKFSPNDTVPSFYIRTKWNSELLGWVPVRPDQDITLDMLRNIPCGTYTLQENEIAESIHEGSDELLYDATPRATPEPETSTTKKYNLLFRKLIDFADRYEKNYTSEYENKHFPFPHHVRGGGSVGPSSVDSDISGQSKTSRLSGISTRLSYNGSVLTLKDLENGYDLLLMSEANFNIAKGKAVPPILVRRDVDNYYLYLCNVGNQFELVQLDQFKIPKAWGTSWKDNKKVHIDAESDIFDILKEAGHAHKDALFNGKLKEVMNRFGKDLIVSMKELLFIVLAHVNDFKDPQHGTHGAALNTVDRLAEALIEYETSMSPPKTNKLKQKGSQKQEQIDREIREILAAVTELKKHTQRSTEQRIKILGSHIVSLIIVALPLAKYGATAGLAIGISTPLATIGFFGGLGVAGLYCSYKLGTKLSYWSDSMIEAQDKAAPIEGLIHAQFPEEVKKEAEEAKKQSVKVKMR